ncbi:MAG: DHH family phosphoesterase [Lachnospiraceae bacterium]|nr:DHH family phosphoesterase [Lachnospiraceae bacterium]
MNGKFKLKGKMLTHLLYPVILGLMAVCIGVYVYVHNMTAGLVILGAGAVYVLVALIMYFLHKPVVMHDLINFAVDYAKVQKVLLRDLAIPYGLMDIDGNILWLNKELEALFEGRDVKGQNVSGIFTEHTVEDFVSSEERKEFEMNYHDRVYSIVCRRINVSDVFTSTQMLSIEDDRDCLVAFYMFDETENRRLLKENSDQRLVAGLIYIDNYEEALESVEDVKKSLLTALIERKINQFGANIDAVVKKLEKDKYFIAFQYKYLEGLQAGKFEILDEVRSVNIGNEMDMTISMGIGYNGDTYTQNCEYSRMAMDMALGRGGDQAVVKDGDRTYYYGGKSKQVEKNTRVKARVKAHALREILSSKENVIIMGHKIGDIDSFGAAIGIYRAVKSLNKKAYIVLNEVTTSLRPMINRFAGNTDYEEDLLIKSPTAIELAKKEKNTAVIVVDVNRPSYTECPELLELCKTVVVLDHHRQTSEIIENALLSYVEPFASSTCEMVAEILQYIQDGIKLKQVEADAMYGGIMIDTNNFTQKTGVRTFEAAAFLRRNGADVTRVRMMFRNDIAEYKARAEAVSRAEVFCEQFAMADCDASGLESPTVVCAQAANELLNISGINASFVLTDYNNRIYISARSIDKINVQLIMERLNGGGHMNIAGAQLDGYTIDEAKNCLRETIKLMIEEGDI